MRIFDPLDFCTKCLFDYLFIPVLDPTSIRLLILLGKNRALSSGVFADPGKSRALSWICGERLLQDRLVCFINKSLID